MISKVSLIIPIFNEGDTALALLKSVMAQPLPGDLQKEMIIIESNSTDGTRELVQKFVQENAGNSPVKIELILEETPRGKGHAVRQGIQKATGDIILIQDGDLEYSVTDYPLLLQPLIDGHVDFVLGSRHLSAGGWKIRKFEQSPMTAFYMNLGGMFFHTLFNILYQVKLTDPTTMYKVFLKKCIDGVAFESNRFDFDFELVAKLIRLGYIPLEVPISYSSRGFEKGKKVRAFRDPFMFLWVIFKFRIKRIQRIPRKAMTYSLN